MGRATLGQDRHEHVRLLGSVRGGLASGPATGKLTASGSVKASALGTITRSGGTEQATYDGHPLYSSSVTPARTRRPGQRQFRREVVAGGPLGSKDHRRRCRVHGRRPGVVGAGHAGKLERRRRLELTLPVTTFPARATSMPLAGRRAPQEAQQASVWAFAGVAVTSFGGPLALAALYAPGIVAGAASASAGLAMVAAVAVSRSAGDLAPLRAARSTAPAACIPLSRPRPGAGSPWSTAGLWIVSYLLTCCTPRRRSCMTRCLPSCPASGSQPVLEIAIPVALAGVMIAPGGGSPCWSSAW